MDRKDLRELVDLVVTALLAEDDEQAWHPMVRARRLIERDLLIQKAERDQAGPKKLDG